MNELPLIVDSFAGGGGASTGIEMALGRSPDIAINHSADALAMHEVNHPDTLHLSKNIWQVDPLDVVGHRRVGLAWFSPDCKHFSKAKGGRPVKRNIRDLAWVVVLWAKRVRPEVIILENVEEFKDWGPVTLEGRPCPQRKGETFRRWTNDLKRLGYRLQWRELRACDYGAPTIRKRLFMIARRDGQPIVWPEPTHGDPKSEAVKSGRLKPWRTAAEIIDWSLPCPSIFDTAEEIMEKHGVRAIRPLADATMRRIARGVVKYVLEAKKPFVVKFQSGATGHSIDEPLATVTANSYVKRPGGAAPLGVVVPSFVGCGGRAGQSAPRGGGDPLGTQTAKADGCVVAPYLVPRYQERAGQQPRVRSVEEPAATIVPGGNEGVLAAVHLSRFTQNGVGSGAAEPVDTVMAGAPKFGVVAAFLAQHNSERNGVNPGRPAQEPMATVTASGAQQQVVAAHLMNMKGSARSDAPADEPLWTQTAGGSHASLIAPFLTKYYGQGDGAEVNGPLHTDTTKDRFGLVTVEIDGATYAIADIGMRMLTPRERFRAQGFPESYVIDRRVDGTPITQTVQGSCCGNSVCPPIAEALVAANCGHLAATREAAE